MKLPFLQHGHALSKDEDPGRPLSVTGPADIERLANVMTGRLYGVRRIRHSGKARAEQTAEIVVAALGRSILIETTDGLAPGDAPQETAALLARLEDETLVASHLPLLEKVISVLVAGGESTRLVRFQPGTLITLLRDEAGGCTVIWAVPPQPCGAGLRLMPGLVSRGRPASGRGPSSR